MQPIFAIVASGFAVSGDIDLRQRRLIGIQVPAIASSGDLSMQGNVDTTSANFMRIQEFRAASGDLRFATGPGSKYLVWPTYIEPPAYARMEIIAAVGSMQTDNRTFTLLTRPR